MNAVNASDVVRRFRVWRLQHRPHTKVDDLAMEVGIPNDVIKKIMMGVSDAPAYMQRITAFLDAAQQGNQQAMQQIAQASELLPDPHAPTRYMVSVLKALSARQRALVEDDDRPYCVIARAEIAPRQCVISRTSKECVGCSAHTKFCLECGFDRTAFPGSDLCAFCLTIALNDPQTDMRTAVLPIKVLCAKSGGQRISIATCNKMQDNACGSCNAATRICSDCKERRVRYPSFGACLRCYTALMAPNWKPLSEQQMTFQRTQRELFFSQCAEQCDATEVVTQDATPKPKQVPDHDVSVVDNNPTILLIAALARLWAAIRRHHQGVPAAVLLPIPAQHIGNVLGGFAALRWQLRNATGQKPMHEVVVVAEHLDRDAADILGTLLHEAAHAQNYERGIADCSKSQYHNGHFKASAEELGLQVEQVLHYGYAKTRALPEMTDRYANEMAHLAAVLIHRRTVFDTALPSSRRAMSRTNTAAVTHRAKPQSRYLKASCGCGFNIRIARATIAATTITCERCKKPFKLTS